MQDAIVKFEFARDEINNGSKEKPLSFEIKLEDAPNPILAQLLKKSLASISENLI